MAIVRWEPLREMDRMRRQMDRLFEDILGGDGGETQEGIYMPAVEFREQERAYILRTMLPGIRKEDVDVEVTQEAVTIRAESRFEKTEEREVTHRSEFRYGRYVRQLALPGAIETEQVQANYQDGILTLTLPKAAQSRARKVQVFSSGTSIPASGQG
ncbi:Hsp20/alpha crystallin family protein [Anthocerotibacter panamensis]|uniref:Hsp20/alpha crystallin family protein n=1 Tax=Anthocerotibacter panamensis TaxID=2857077 RepID=UPI001C40226F|nr:Hsp20/alpha crystallin family protein [Anthocerotibacter panamensis]